MRLTREKLPLGPARYGLMWLAVTAGSPHTQAVVAADPSAKPASESAPADGNQPPSRVDFGRQIQPILAQRCFKCHGPDKNEGGLRLNRRETALAEIDSGSRAIVPGLPDESALLERITETDESIRMPPEGKPLSRNEADLFRRWIAEGAEWEQYWAFQPVQAPSPPPRTSVADWPATPIDAFILHRLERNGLQPSPTADRPALLRRATFDLTGLPPTPDEVNDNLADDAPRAFSKRIDRLLAAPAYGEKWGRHWLDLVRYAETNSFERDAPKPNVWRFRDYVIHSFNDDKPYDRFVTEQLAGDELDDVTRETLIATGYYRLGLWDDEPVDEEQAYFDEMDDVVRTTAEVFLGLTVGCARCHDHKIDPIPQADYYRMLAFFRGVRTYGIRSDQQSNNQIDISPPHVAEQHAQHDRQKRSVGRAMRKIEDAAILKMPGEDQRKTETDQRDQVLAEKLSQYLDAKQQLRYDELKAELARLEQARLPPRELALGLNRNDRDPPVTHVLLRGNAHAQGAQVSPGFPALFAAADPEIPVAPQAATSAGRRRVLAEWIVSSDNQLAGRVLANRLWQFHFGRGIVRSPNNFGQLGDRPTHPELLDWLAAEFVRRDWQIKAMHRLIMHSAAYQMSSRGNPAGLQHDPANDLFWRYDMRRLSAEEVRDAIHATSGQLNRTMCGPSIYPEISEEVLQGQSRPGSGWHVSPGVEQARRSVYIHVKRSLIVPLLATFDAADTDSSCAARFVTTQPAQALGLMNGDFANQQAEAFADRLRLEAGSDRKAQVRRALWLALNREPDDRDVKRGLALMEQLESEHGVDEQTALEYYCLMVLNLNEFVYLD